MVPPAKIHFGTSFLMLAVLICSSGLKRQPAYVRLYMSQLPASRSAFSRRASLTSRHSALRPGEGNRSEEHTSELQSQSNLVCRLLLEKKQRCPSHPHDRCSHRR